MSEAVRMISIVISEKGGAERRERYEQNEITIGRVKGNDVLLPKGNVSKRHARLIMRDGRFIVTDLKSTNGTYVNHRRITHATLVREGDRIYIGDFVLRIDGDSRGSERPSQGDIVPDSSTGPRASYGVSSSGMVPSVPPELSMPPQHEVVSHFPIEHDPDDSSPSVDVPAPPRIPSGFKPTGTGPHAMPSDPLTADGGTSRPASPPARSSSGPAVSSEPHTPVAHANSAAEIWRQGRASLSAVLEAVEERIGAAALASATLLPALVSRIEQALDESLGEVVERGLPAGIEPSALREAARLELTSLGPLQGLIDDEAISRIQVMKGDVVLHRRGRRVHYEGFGFGTDTGVARALTRLCHQAGQPDLAKADDSYLALDLGEGRQLFAVRPPASADGHMLVVERSVRRATTIDGLVRSGAISRGMATLLSHCISAGANLMVAGTRDGGTWDLLDAIASAVPSGHRTLWLDSGEAPPPEEVVQLRLGASSEDRRRAIDAALRLGAERVIVPSLLGTELTQILDSVTQGAQGITLAVTAGTLRQAVDRLAADLATTRPALTTQTAREWLGASFDLGLEVTQLRDGRLRVVRMAEFRSGHQGTSLRDIFTFSYHRTAAGGSIEGAFYASGTVPRIVDDLAARGMPLDQSIFRRHPSG
ncbi:MAG: FHA domain-containing protein [Polyangiaceae bacterium]